MTDPLLRVDDLHVRPADPDARVANGEILEGLDLVVASGELHAIIGPHGSGGSTLGSTLMGSPAHEVTAGSITFRGDDVTRWPVDERAKAGMFLAFQHPQAIAGVSVIQLLHQALAARTRVDLSAAELRLATMDWAARLGMEASSVDRSLDEGFSDGQKRCFEIMQVAILEPELAILDESRSGLEIHDLQIFANGIREVRRRRESLGVVLVAHDSRLLDEIGPDHVHVLLGGRIVESGGMELAEQLARSGYDSFQTGAAV